MKLKSLLDSMYDETWVRITKPNGEQEEVWVADYLGGYEATIETLTPILSCEIVDEVDMVIDTNPETKKGKVPILCVKLIGEQELARIPQEDIFTAVKKDCGYRGRQKIDSYYWDDDRLVFCNNIPNYGGEHYEMNDFIEQMSEHFPSVKGADDVMTKDGCFHFLKKSE